MTKIAIYLFGYDNAQRIATRTIKDKHWYMARDICAILGIQNHSQAVHRDRPEGSASLTDEEWRKETIYIGGYGKRRVLLVNNAGLLKLVFQSTTLAARDAQARARTISEALIPSEWSAKIQEMFGLGQSQVAAVEE